MNKEEWTDEVYRLLCVSQGAPNTEEQENNLREWAQNLSTEEAGFYGEGYTPEEAHDEEMSEMDNTF